LADFGSTKEGTSNTAQITKGGHGTKGYRAPELFQPPPGTAEYTNKVDIWSMGCILYELAVGQRPFQDDWATFRYANAGRDLRVSIEDTRIKKWILRSLPIKSSSRPSASALLDEFITYLSYATKLDQAKAALMLARAAHDLLTSAI
jgi:serine/threonine protein kinase